MSPASKDTRSSQKRFPRVSGDEPASNGGDLYPEAFSPRERG